MGGELEGKERLGQVLTRCKEVFDYLFTNKHLWIRLTLWNVNSFNTLQELFNCGFKFESATHSLEVNEPNSLYLIKQEDSKVYYLYYNSYTFDSIYPLLLAIASFELALEPSANITAYFLNFNDKHPVFVNLYDDRGMKVVFKDKKYYNEIYNKFEKFVLK